MGGTYAGVVGGALERGNFPIPTSLVVVDHYITSKSTQGKEGKGVEPYRHQMLVDFESKGRIRHLTDTSPLFLENLPV